MSFLIFAPHLHEENEVLERSVEVRLFAQLHHFGEMLVVNVGIHSEESLQDCFGIAYEILGERHT